MYNDQTFEVIKERLLTDPNTQKTGLATNEGSFLDNIFAAKAADEAKLYMAMSYIFDLVFIEDSCDEFLDKRVNEFGVYRKAGEFSAGKVQFSGDKKLIPAGTVLVANNLEYRTLEDIDLSAEEIEKDTSIVEASEVGYKYNIPVDTVFEIADSSLEGVVAKAIQSFEAGRDTETDAELKERFYDTQRNNATSGNTTHYRQWALEVPGVYDAKVTPLWQGAGTVKVAIAGKDNKPCTPEIVKSCEDYIESVRPIGSTVTVSTIKEKKITVSATVTLNNASLEDAKIEATDNILNYLSKVDKEVMFVKIEGAIAVCDSILNLEDVKINGATNNVSITEDEAIVLEAVNLTDKGAM